LENLGITGHFAGAKARCAIGKCHDLFEFVRMMKDVFTLVARRPYFEEFFAPVGLKPPPPPPPAPPPNPQKHHPQTPPPLLALEIKMFAVR